MPLIAIITRTKDRPLLLERAARSITGQTCKDFLWVIVNDGGDPEAVTQVLAPFLPALAHPPLRLDHAQSLGMEAASNAGIKASQSKYLVIHDDDDTWEPQFLEATLAVLENPPHPSVRAAVTHTTEIQERIDDGQVRELSRRSYNGFLVNLQILNYLRENKTPPISFVYARSVHDAIGYYDEDLKVLGDWDFFLRFYQRFEAVLVRRHLANYHLRPSNSAGTYGNSVTAGIDLHAFYGQLLWNRLLRSDLQAGKTGIGTLIATIQAVEIASHRLDYPLAFLVPAARAKAEGHGEVLVCGAGEAGRRAAFMAKLLGLKVRAFTDRNPNLQGASFDGAPVISLDEGLRLGLPCLVGSLPFATEIRDQIASRALELGLTPPPTFSPEHLL